MTLPSPALGDRSLFPALKARAYLNHGGISPPSRAVSQAVRALLDDYEANGAGGYLRWAEQRERLRSLMARLLGASPGDIALSPNTTRGVSDIALCFRFRPGDGLALFEGEFPSNVTPWQRAAELHGLRVQMLSLDGFRRSADEGLASLEAALTRGVRLVAVSAVQFQTGHRMPLAAMSALCHRHGARLFVDAVQAVGAVPLDVTREGIDYLAAGSHKWMMGLEGAGLVYVRPEALGDLSPRVAGWLSHTEATRFLFEGAGLLRYDRPIKASAAFLEGGNVNAAGCAGLEASLGLIEALGVEAIHAHVNRYLDRLEEGLLALGFRSERSVRHEERSCTLSVLPPDDRPIAAWSLALGERGVACATPDGRLRFTPHWPNALDEVPFVLDAVREVASRRGG